MSETNLKEYYLFCNKRLLNNIPETLGRVLEFGCSGGMLGNTYKKTNPDTIWHGIDVFEPALAHAKTRLDAAWKLDANELKPNKTMLKEKYDALIYGDVVEHLIQPEESLPAHFELLKKGGYFITCIPNVQHWSIIQQVLGGNWEYTDQGLMDRTHLRFFTRTSYLNLLKKLNLDLVKMERISYENTKGWMKHADTRQTLLNSLEALCKDNNLNYNNYDFRTFQYVFVAQKNH
jgi:2-polyprenyl-3-methyl-5-hydroxy-6-metoxy-1,4-benzoquinol methylase